MNTNYILFNLPTLRKHVASPHNRKQRSVFDSESRNSGGFENLKKNFKYIKHRTADSRLTIAQLVYSLYRRFVNTEQVRINVSG